MIEGFFKSLGHIRPYTRVALGAMDLVTYTHKISKRQRHITKLEGPQIWQI